MFFPMMARKIIAGSQGYSRNCCLLTATLVTYIAVL